MFFYHEIYSPCTIMPKLFDHCKTENNTLCTVSLYENEYEEVF